MLPGPSPESVLADHRRGRLAILRPQTTAPAAGTGLHTLGLDRGSRDGLLYVPAQARAGGPAPLLVLLHGAGGSARGGLEVLLPYADAAGLLLLSPDSRGRTWDMILGGYGPDVAYLDSALSAVLARAPVDTARMAIGGFSDGASYALSLGLANGDVFGAVLAFSPGFMAPLESRGRPRVFVAHGAQDRVLPIDRCSRRLVPVLRRAGYDLSYREFDGGHGMPAGVVAEAVDWMADQWPAR
ncbi:MAG: alpha/beta hydrolase [Mycobacteriales bacterium]